MEATDRTTVENDAARDIAMIYGVSQIAIICAMHRSERINLVRRVSKRAWVPVERP